MVVGGMSDKINPPTPADCRPLSTRTINNRVTEITNPTVQSAMKNIQNNVSTVLLSHVHLEMQAV